MTGKNDAAFTKLNADGVWVVGGALRDALAGNEGDQFDLDLAAPNAAQWAQQAAAQLGTRAVECSRQHQIWRLPLPKGQIDVCPLPPGGIEEDLPRRDFTLNALAVPLSRYQEGDLRSNLVDPFGGLADIRRKRLRLVSAAALRDDPLRLLRAVRLEAEGGWRPDDALRSAMRRDAPLLSTAAPERQWDEFRRLLLHDRLPWALRRLEQTKLLDALLPELADCRSVDQRPVHRRDVFWHQLDAVRWLLRLTAAAPPRGRRPRLLWTALQPLLAEESIRQQLDEWRLPLRFAVLLHDIGKPQTKTVDANGRTHFYGHSELGAELAQARLQALRVPAALNRQVQLLIAQHLRPGQLSAPGRPPTNRALHRFHTAVGEAAAPLCLLFLADSLATAGAPALLPRWPAYAAHIARILHWQPQRPPHVGRLLDGHAIMAAAELPPGPLVGLIRAKIDEAAAVGAVDNRDAAEALARRLARELAAEKATP